MYDKILVPVDGSEVSTGAVKEAAELAKRLGSKVRLLYILDASMMAIPDAETGLVDISVLRNSFKAVGRKALDDAASLMSSAGVDVETSLVEGDVHESIVDDAESSKADLIVMGTHGRRGFNRLILGSVAESVARRATCGVMLVRPKEG